MARKRIFAAVFVLILLLSGTSTVFALNLVFRVDKSTTDLYLLADGSAKVEYTYVFVNDPGGDPIDAVDIGLPTGNYSLSNVRAEIDGSPITSIEDSPYVKPGIAINLQSKQIMPGKTGTIHFAITGITGMIFKTDKVQNVQEPYGSFQFSPNSFGSQYVRGKTDMSVTLHLPPGEKDTEPRWYNPQNWAGDTRPTSGVDDAGSVFYTWKSPLADSHTQYIFGGAFPTRLVPASALVVESPLNSIGNNVNFDLICPWIFCLGFFGFIAFVLFGSASAEKKRRLQYFPPKIAIEGNGIKRGLTAVEAAILLEQPLDKVLSMILFSVVKKGAAEVVVKEPLKIKATAATGLDLQTYELDFIKAMTSDNKVAIRTGLQNMMVELVKSITSKMRGFSRKETVAYYQDIMTKAWAQVEAAGTPDLKMQKFDEVMDWTMLDHRFEDRSRESFGRGPVILPIWWNRYDPGFGRSTFSTPSSGPAQVGQAPSGMSMPSLPGADFAASMVGGIQSFSSNVVGDITSFTSNITNSTNPVPVVKSSSSGGSSGGSHSCACACACAGCACACAGGGR